MDKLLTLIRKHQSYLVVLFFTLLSHAMGFGREVAIAYMFGATSISDGILVGIAPVTLFLGMMGVGYSNAAMARIKSADNHQTIEQSLHPLLVASGIAGLFFFAFGDVIIGITAPGITGEGYKLATYLVKFSALSAGVICIYYWFRGVRYLEQQFLRVSLSELGPNIGILTGILVLFHFYGVLGIALGITMGYLIQLAVVFDSKRINLKGFGPKTLLSEDSKVIYKNCFYGALGMSGIIVELFVDRYFASSLAEGSVASINFAYKVMTLPLYTFVVAIVTVLFPKLIALRENRAEFKRSKEQISWVLIGFCLLTSAVLIVFSELIISLLFQYGQFSASDVKNTAPLLQIYAVGLTAHALVMLHSKARFALEDFRTPLIAGAIAALVNLVLDFVLVGPYGTAGLAWATSIAAVVNALIVIFVSSAKALPK